MKFGDSLPSLLVEDVDNSLQLPLVNLGGLISLPLLQSLSNTEDDLQSSIHSGLGLVGNKLIGITEHRTTLRVSEDDPGDLGIDQLLGSDLSSVSTGRSGETVLSGDLVGMVQVGMNLEQVDGRRSNDDL